MVQEQSILLFHRGRQIDAKVNLNPRWVCNKYVLQMAVDALPGRGACKNLLQKAISVAMVFPSPFNT